MSLPATFCAGFHDEEHVHKVRYTRFGSTEISVSQIAFGCSGLGWVQDERGEMDAVEAVREALRSGINYLDTAPWYGHGKGEALLGKALEGVPRSAYYIATKVGRYEAAYERMFDFSAARTMSSVQESLRRLGLRSLDVLQVHDVEFAPSIEYILQETLPALDSLKRAGKARYIGITGYPLSTLREIVERSPVRIDTVLSYCRGTLFDDTLRDYVPFFLGRGMGVANAAVLGMGLLARGPLPAWHPASDDLVAACRSAKAHCQEAGVSVEKLGLWYSTNHFDGVHTTIVGMTNTDEVKQNLNAGTINSKERKVLDDLRRRYFLPLQVRHWEGRELQKVRSKLGKK